MTKENAHLNYRTNRVSYIKNQHDQVDKDLKNYKYFSFSGNDMLILDRKKDILFQPDSATTDHFIKVNSKQYKSLNRKKSNNTNILLFYTKINVTPSV